MFRWLKGLRDVKYSSRERQERCAEESTEQWKRGQTSYKRGTGGNFTGICAECRICRCECVGKQGSGGRGAGPEGTGVSQVCVSVSNGTINSPSSSIMRPRNHKCSNISLHKVITGPLLALINLHIRWVLLCALPFSFSPVCLWKVFYKHTSPSVSTGQASSALDTDRVPTIPLMTPANNVALLNKWKIELEGGLKGTKLWKTSKAELR